MWCHAEHVDASAAALRPTSDAAAGGLASKTKVRVHRPRSDGLPCHALKASGVAATPSSLSSCLPFRCRTTWVPALSTSIACAKCFETSDASPRVPRLSETSRRQGISHLCAESSGKHMQCWVRMECRKSGCKSLVGQLQKHKWPVISTFCCHTVSIRAWAERSRQFTTDCGCAANPMGMDCCSLKAAKLQEVM